MRDVSGGALTNYHTKRILSSYHLKEAVAFVYWAIFNVLIKMATCSGVKEEQDVGEASRTNKIDES